MILLNANELFIEIQISLVISSCLSKYYIIECSMICLWYDNVWHLTKLWCCMPWCRLVHVCYDIIQMLFLLFDIFFYLFILKLYNFSSHFFVNLNLLSIEKLIQTLPSTNDLSFGLGMLTLWYVNVMVWYGLLAWSEIAKV